MDSQPKKENGALVTMEKIISLCKRRGFVFPGSEIYGGLANSWDYGPVGTELKNNIKQLWWKRFVRDRADMVGVDAALIMNPKVWEASGHVKEFSDPLIECKKCHNRFRADEIENLPYMKKAEGASEDPLEIIRDNSNGKRPRSVCPDCKSEGSFTGGKMFNLMFKTFLGPVEDEKSIVYFRPETAQAMFVDFKNVLTTARKQLPFGIAQIGKAFRNEITPGNFIFRTREFEQMEIEYFVCEKDWKKYFEMWRKEMHDWMEAIGLDLKNVHDAEIPDGERAHYSKRTIDFEYDFPFGRKELYGLAYRTDFDLKNHFTEPPYRDAESGEEFWPHVIEPTWGVDRSVLAVLLASYHEDGDRVVLKFKPRLAPFKAAVFPLLANKPELVNLAKNIYDDLRKSFYVAWDDRGNIGKRYYAQDEIGTPFCVTVDFDSLEKKDVTVRDRDTTKQERISIGNLKKYLNENLWK